MKKVSVITIVWNCVNELQATIDSVVAQDYEHIEYIVVDGASTDGTLELIRANEVHITTWISEPDKGIYDAMNKGVELATGDYINFMNAGDTFYAPDVISAMFTPTSSADILYGNINCQLHIGDYLWRPYPLEQMTQRMVMGHQSIFAKSALMKELRFDTSYRSSGDYDFVYRCYQRGCSFEYRDVTVGNFESEAGISNNNYALVERENARIHGVDQSWGWRLKFALQLPWHHFKQWTKRLLPQRVVEAIRRKNMQAQQR